MASYPMDNRDVINIGLRIIKRCGMHAEDFKNWISRKNAVPLIIEMINSFKESWADAIALVNHMAVLALQHEYGMAVVDNNALLASYGDSLADFGTVYATMQETMKSQADSLAAMQGQFANIQQFCMTVCQQPPSGFYTPPQQQGTFNNCNKCNGGGQGSG